MTKKSQLNVHIWGDKPYLIYPSIIIIILSVFALAESIFTNFFWADDFGNLAAFSHSVGKWGDFSVNAGRPILNLFFYVMGTSFGTGLAAPYLLSASLVFVLGIILIFRSIVSLGLLSMRMAIFVLAILLASVTPWPIFLWSTNITHGAAIFSLGVAFFLFSKNSKGESFGSFKMLWEALWFFLIVLCNPLYLGVIIVFSSLFVASRIKKFGSIELGFRVKILFYVIISMLLPMAYFFLISQPQQKKNLSYANTNIQNILPNINYYTGGIFDSTIQIVLFIVIIVFLLLTRGYTEIDLALLIASFSILIPVLVQSQQRVLNYLVLPIVFLGIFIGRIFERSSGAIFLKRLIIYFILVLLPLSVFISTQNTRAWYIKPGLGAETRNLLNQIHTFTPSNSKICLAFQLETEDANYLIGGFSGGSAFAISPNYSPDTLINSYSKCDKDKGRLQISISKNSSGTYQAILHSPY